VTGEELGLLESVTNSGLPLVMNDSGGGGNNGANV